MIDKIKRYDRATAKLVHQARNMVLPPHWTDTPYRLALVTAISREYFKNPVVREEILLPQYEQERMASCNFSQGFCCAVSYFYHHFFRLSDGLPLFYVRHIGDFTPGWTGGAHAYLENAVDKTIFDPTFDQFIDENGDYIEIPYELGKYANARYKSKRGINFAKFHDIDLHWDGTHSPRAQTNYTQSLYELIKEK